MQIKGKFDTKTIQKIGTGTVIAGLGAGSVYIIQGLTGMDFGQASALVTAVGMIGVNCFRMFMKDRGGFLKLAKQGGIAAGGAGLIYALQFISSGGIDFGNYTPLIVALASTLINVIKERQTGQNVR